MSCSRGSGLVPEPYGFHRASNVASFMEPAVGRLSVADTDKEFLDDLGGFDLKMLDQAEKEYLIPREVVVALAKGTITHREALGVTDETIQKLAEYGYALVENQFYSQAAALFDGLVTLDPNVAYFHLGLGMALRNLGHNDAAAVSFMRAKQLDKEDMASTINLAQVLLDLGRKDEARTLLEEAKSLDPKGAHPLAPAVKRMWVAHFEPA